MASMKKPGSKPAVPRKPSKGAKTIMPKTTPKAPSKKIPMPKTTAPTPGMPTRRPAVGGDKAAKKKYGSGSWNNGYTN